MLFVGVQAFLSEVDEVLLEVLISVLFSRIEQLGGLAIATMRGMGGDGFEDGRCNSDKGSWMAVPSRKRSVEDAYVIALTVALSGS